MSIKDKIGDVAGKVGDAAANLTGKGDDSPDNDTSTPAAAADTGHEPAEAEDQDPMRIPPPQMHEIDPSGKVSNP